MAALSCSCCRGAAGALLLGAFPCLQSEPAGGVLWKGGAVIVRSDDPTATYEIEPIHPITGVFSVPEHKMTLFADFTHLAGYGAEGLIWTSPRLALDDLTVSGVDGEVITATGFFGGGPHEPITVDLHTGLPLSPLPLDFSNREV
jgi:hypothetical protein